MERRILGMPTCLIVASTSAVRILLGDDAFTGVLISCEMILLALRFPVHPQGQLTEKGRVQPALGVVVPGGAVGDCSFLEPAGVLEAVAAGGKEQRDLTAGIQRLQVSVLADVVLGDGAGPGSVVIVIEEPESLSRAVKIEAFTPSGVLVVQPIPSTEHMARGRGQVDGLSSRRPTAA